jgi:hypothetical protein
MDGDGASSEPAADSELPSGRDNASDPSTPPSDVGSVAGGHRLSRKLLLVTGAAVLVIGAAALIVVLATSSTADPFAPGSGTATITWTSASGSSNPTQPYNNPPPQPFGGNIDGLPLSGVATIDLSGLSSAALNPTSGTPVTLHFFEIKGTFEGKRFVLELYVHYVGSPLAQQPVFPKIEVLGSYGNEPVQANLAPPAADLTHPNATLPPSTPILFNGTIGKLKVSGAVVRPTIKNGQNNTVKATFTVS